jgi:predicted secreted protein
MRYRLRTLIILTALAPPVLAGLWFMTHSIAGMLAWALFAAFFAFWYWQLCISQAMHLRTAGNPNNDSGASGGESGAL